MATTVSREGTGKIMLGAFCASEGRRFLKPRLELLSSVIGEGMGEGEGGCRFVRHDGWMDGWMDGWVCVLIATVDPGTG